MSLRRGRPCRVRITLLASILAIGPACRSRGPAGESSGISVRAESRPPVVPADSPFAVDYTWTMSAGAVPLSDGYATFVHFVHPDGAIAFTDDHVPDPPPRSWRPGESHRYTRTLFAPAEVFPGKLEIRVGLFHPQTGRVALAGKDAGLQEYVVGEVQVGPADGRRRLRYGSGWYPPDAPPDDPFAQRRWTAREAWLSFRNREEDVIVLLRGETNAKAFAKPPVLTLTLGAATAAVPIADSAPFDAAVRFPAAAAGRGRWAELRLVMSGSFVPSALGMNADRRELGLWVHHVFVGPAREIEPLLSPSLRPIAAEMAPAQKSK